MRWDCQYEAATIDLGPHDEDLRPIECQADTQRVAAPIGRALCRIEAERRRAAAQQQQGKRDRQHRSGGVEPAETREERAHDQRLAKQG